MKLLFLALLMATQAWSMDLVEEKAERHYQAGLQMLAKSRFKDAAEELSVASILEPQRADIKDVLENARQSRSMGVKPGPEPIPHPEGTATVSELADSAQAQKNSEAILVEARQAYRESDLNHASDAWNRALLMDKDSQEAKEGLAKLLDESYKKDADQPFDSSVADLYTDALRDARKERYVEARKKLEQALALNPAQAQVKALLAKIESGAFAQQGGRDADEALGQGQRFLESGDWAMARNCLDKANHLRPEDKSTLAALELLREKAAPAVKEMLAKAAKAARAKDDESARLQYQKALAIEPSDPEAQKGLKKAEKRLEKDKGQASLKQKADALYNEGVEAWQSGRLGFAATCFRDAVDLDPEDVEALKALDMVRSKLATQSDKDKEQSSALSQQASALEEKGQLKEALDLMERAAAKDSGNTQASAAAARLREQLHGK